TAIKKKLETFYNTYYKELELYANQQQQFGFLTIEYHNNSNIQTEEQCMEDVPDICSTNI
ncbi:4572_t:CDS:2, partial [Gigaspora margarita]